MLLTKTSDGLPVTSHVNLLNIGVIAIIHDPSAVTLTTLYSHIALLPILRTFLVRPNTSTDGNGG